MKLTPQQKAFVEVHEKEDVHMLALRYKEEGMLFLLTQIAGLQVAKKKIPSWYRQSELLYPQHISLEQASSETTAKYKASLVIGKGELLVDLTGGLGVDFSFLAPLFSRAIYVERDETLCHLAKHNFEVLGLLHAEVHHMDCEVGVSMIESASLIYVDPARRDVGGRKVFRIEDCVPDLSQLADRLIEKAEKVMVKYSPMLDITLAIRTLPQVLEVHVVSVENECKELLFVLSKECVSGKETLSEPLYYAVNLKKDGVVEQLTFLPSEEEREAIYCESPGSYLYEPNSSILKAGAFNVVAYRYGLQKLHKQSHLYTSNQLVEDFPGRSFRVKQWFRADKKQIRCFLSTTPQANITVRNYPVSVAEIRKRWQVGEGGDTYVFATTLGNGKRVWISGEKVGR